MTESEYWEKLKGSLGKLGKAIRLEDVPASMPDIVLLTKTVTIWLELKIIRSGKAAFRKFQRAQGYEMSKASPRRVFVLSWDEDKNVHCLHTYESIGLAKLEKSTSSKIYINMHALPHNVDDNVLRLVYTAIQCAEANLRDELIGDKNE